MKARSIAYQLVSQWTNNQGYPEALLQRAFSHHPKLSRQDKALVTELFYGTIRWLNQLDYIIDLISSVKPDKIELRVRNLLRIGLYQIFHTHIPDPIAVYETVEIAKKHFPKWLVRFVNALLRTAVREKQNIRFPERDLMCCLALKYAHPLWLIKRWVREFGLEETTAMCTFNNQPPLLTLRTNTLKVKRSVLRQCLEEAGVEVEEGLAPEALIVKRMPCSLHELPGFKSGHFLPQAEVSQLISHLLSPKPGEVVLDACAGIGGKTTHLAQLMRNKGQIFAIEPNLKRFNRLKRSLKKLGIDIVYPKHGAIEKIVTAFPENYFDRILIDAPCSGLGVLRRNVDLKWQRREEDILALASLQYALLEAVAPYLKRGKSLLYVTCTLTQEENEGVIKRFLEKFPDFQIESLVSLFPAYAKFCTSEGFFKTLPFKHHVEGFFAARLKKGLFS